MTNVFNYINCLDRKYLESMAKFYDGGPVGIDTMATILAESKDTIEDTVEPYLIQNGFIARTPRGRIATKISYEHFQLVPPKDNGLLDLD